MVHLDPSLPSTLMPLVCPYLSYEDAVRCMQLNSSFYRYIDDNWKDVTKKAVYINIRKPSSLSVIFGECKLTKGGFNFGPGTTIFIENTVLQTSALKTPTFLREYLNKQESPKSESGKEYIIANEADGLKIIMDALLLRCSLSSFDIDFSGEEYGETELNVICKCLTSHYKQHGGKSHLNFKMKNYKPIFNNIITAFGARKITMTQEDFCFSTSDIEHVRENTNIAYIRVIASNFATESVVAFINDWYAGNLDNVSIRVTAPDTKTSFYEKFEEVYTKLGVDPDSIECSGRCIYVSYEFKMTSRVVEKGKKLRVLCLEKENGCGSSYLDISEIDSH